MLTTIENDVLLPDAKVAPALAWARDVLSNPAARADRAVWHEVRDALLAFAAARVALHCYDGDRETRKQAVLNMVEAGETGQGDLLDRLAWSALRIKSQRKTMELSQDWDQDRLAALIAEDQATADKLIQEEFGDLPSDGAR